jgi:hypothetical protein
MEIFTTPISQLNAIEVYFLVNSFIAVTILGGRCVGWIKNMFK